MKAEEDAREQAKQLLDEIDTEELENGVLSELAIIK